MGNQNLQIWEAVEKTDPQHTKPFNRGGGFKGTATNATYLAKRATETFGPMGIGWGVEVEREEYVEGAPLDGNGTRETIHKVLVKLWYKHGEQRGEIRQYGQTTFIGKNKHGLTTDEEHAKKSLTDGMSKCLSLLGFSADIHLGRYDDNKYVAEVSREFSEKREAERRANSPKISEQQCGKILDLIKATDTDVIKFCDAYGIQEVNELLAADFDGAYGALTKKLNKKRQEATQ
ncbi:hypothetical protein CAI21_21580 [Alkalilimnicola ehrlichii]|uniref:Rad52/22 double-strand break repair protein n=1 Tax=Alkalilimnicola ehrlichii TaxID=351052 RepID=A0A3E0WQC1_9GAMM|nr:hypothetical protein [Alkalilimnicola ehrlichii]RFA24417.1 hypothetical protein CAI21_21580 [Alkalilimnicola ehrlichii]RFA35170.1 hypothetical protein CAL65_13785 [Alkalilimnicola ehrlichii]